MKISRFSILIGYFIFSMNVSALVFTRTTETAGLSTDLKQAFGNPIWGDINNDDYVDLIVPHHGHTPDIYLNNRDSTFGKRHVTSVFGVDFFNEYNDFHGYSFTDFNNDNILDLFITVGAKQGEPGFTKRDLLYQGNGNGSFELVSTTAGIENATGRGRSSCWFDYDGDGNLDFLLKNLNTPNIFFLNLGQGTFSDITTSTGLDNYEDGSVCSLVDYDNDGRLDIFLNSGGLKDTLLRQLPDGTFSDVSATAGISASGFSNSAAWGDYNNDGFMDLYVTRSAPFMYTGSISDLDLENILYTNNGDGTFTDTTEFAGFDGNFNTAMAVWGDINNDGNLDLFVSNAGETDGSGNNSFLYINNADGTFTDSADQSNINNQADVQGHRHTTAALSDYNNDGALDLILGGSGINTTIGATELYRNEDNANNYLKVRLIGIRANSPAIGSVITLVTQTSTQVRQHTGANDGVLFSQSLQPIHFGTGLDNIASINVLWPKGAGVTNQTFENLATNQMVVLKEGRSIVRGRTKKMTDPGCYLWRNNLNWNMCCIGKATQTLKFTGQLSSNGVITTVSGVNFEANDSVTSTANTIDFELLARQSHDTISFTTTGDTITFDIFQDGIHQPRSVRIGEYSILPAVLPVTLTE